MYRTGGHGTLDLWFNVKLSRTRQNGLTLNHQSKKWFNIKRDLQKWFNIKPLPHLHHFAPFCPTTSSFHHVPHPIPKLNKTAIRPLAKRPTESILLIYSMTYTV